MTDTRAWPEPVERVAAFLREAGTEARVEQFFKATPTAREAARAAGCEPAQIVKSLVFDCAGRSVLVLVPGDRRADAGKVARAAGSAVARVAGADQVQEATGFPPGAVAPFPVRRIDRVLIDPIVLAQELVWIGAGSPNHLAALAPGDLARLAQAETVDVVERLPQPRPS